MLDVAENRSWRLFQMAFMLLNLPSLTDLHHPDRSHETDAVADLLWFATGGGKTEAYLGLTAYTLALRRLQGEIDWPPRRSRHRCADALHAAAADAPAVPARCRASSAPARSFAVPISGNGERRHSGSACG